MRNKKMIIFLYLRTFVFFKILHNYSLQYGCVYIHSCVLCAHVVCVCTINRTSYIFLFYNYLAKFTLDIPTMFVHSYLLPSVTITLVLYLVFYHIQNFFLQFSKMLS